MEEDELLKNENVKQKLSPHPLSFMKFQSLCLFLIIWGILIGWIVNFSEYKQWFESDLVAIMVWALVILLVGVIASLLIIRWSIFFLYLGIVLIGIAVMFWQGWQMYYTIFLPFYTVGISIGGFLIVELYRRSHKYIISDLRIIFKGGILTKRERTLRYDKITDIDGKQGILGQIFGFGTIIPISQAGFGLGSDTSLAAGGIEVAPKKVGFLGIFGGEKEVQTPRARSYYELHGVYPYRDVRSLVENFVQGSVITPYQQEQVAFQKEQVDIQKQMKELLKKQLNLKEDSEKEKNE